MPLFEIAADSTKQALSPFWNQRITVCAVMSCYGTNYSHRMVMAVEQVYHGSELVADHLWLPCTRELYALQLDRGEWLQCEGRVIRYVKKYHPNLFHYKLDDIRSPQRLFTSETTHE